MRFRYIGNPRDLLDLHPQITAFGLTFPLDEPVEVTDPRAIGKLKRNTHFEALLGEVSARETEEDGSAATITPGEHAAALGPLVPSPPAPVSSSPPASRGGRRRG